jgi:hypothetical protein
MNAITKTLPSKRSDAVKADGNYYAYTEQQLRQHDIRIGYFEMAAQRDQNNRVFWFLTGCETTTCKRTARKEAMQASKLMTSGAYHEPLNR